MTCKTEDAKHYLAMYDILKDWRRRRKGVGTGIVKRGEPVTERFFSMKTQRNESKGNKRCTE